MSDAPLSDRDVDELLAAVEQHRASERRRRAWTATSVSIAVTATWLVYVTAWGHWNRVTDMWVAAVTMVFGSFVAGATPQGGGAVAFPVFTKGLDVPSEVARSFALCIQAIGMGTAALAIWIRRRRVDRTAIAVALPAAIGGFLVGYVMLSDRSQPFAPSLLPSAYVKVGFTLLTAAMAYVTFLAYRAHALWVQPTLPARSRRIVAMLVCCGAFGGVAASQVGSGADVFVYLALVVLVGVSPRTGVPTSVVVMGIVSVFALAVIGLVDGQLVIGLDGAGDVDSLGGVPLDEPLDPGRFDLFGLWVAAVPIVAWGAPLGSWVTSRLGDRPLVLVVVALAALEVATTVAFVTELHDDPALVAFSATSAVMLLGCFAWVQRNRVRLLRLSGLDADTTLRRAGIDLGDRFYDHLGRRVPNHRGAVEDR